MAIYVIGDLHGCYREFRKLLKKINFKKSDTLYLVGDLINRGPKSVETLEFIINNQDNIYPILGNHDLSFLVYAEGYSRLKRGDTYDTLMNHSRFEEFKNYLRHLPLIHYLEPFNIAIAHAGIPHFWSISKAIDLANEATSILRSSHKKTYTHFIKNMFGNHPDRWNDNLQGDDRIRVVINYLTRMRLLYSDGSMDFITKGKEYDTNKLQPWFTFNREKQIDTTIIFGHWASLGLHQENNTICIDSGCVWKEKLTAIRIDSPEFIFFHKKRN